MQQQQDHSRSSSAADRSSSSKDAAAAGPWQEQQQQETAAAAAENADVAAIGDFSCSMCWQWTYRPQGEHDIPIQGPTGLAGNS